MRNCCVGDADSTDFIKSGSTADNLDFIGSKSDIMVSSVINTKSVISGDSIKSVRDIMTLLLETIKQNQDMCLLLFSDNGDKNFLRNILMFALPSAVDNWVKELGMNEKDATVLYYYVMGGAVNVIELWMKDKLSATLDEVADKLNSLVMGSQKALA